jgi:hypothetical protein
MTVRGVGTAYTYAWWLTGDDDAAAAAVRTALQSAPNGDQLALLRAVREASPDAAMLPPSELALLHDVCGIDLGTAATLVGVAKPEAAAMLASGRLEALTDSASAEIAHPERLGGLAVRRPADIAHARRCKSCGEISERIQRGRDELLSIAPVAPPSDLLGGVGAEETAAPPEEPVAEEQPPVAPRGETVTPLPGADEPDLGVEAVEPAEELAPAPEELEPAPEELEHAEELEPAPEELEHAPEELKPQRREGPSAQLVLIGLGALILVVALVFWLFSGTQAPETDPGDQPVLQPPGSTPAATEPQTQPTTATTAPTTEATSPPTAPTTEFTVAAAGVLPQDGDTPAPSGATIAPDEPLRLAVDYSGAASGVLLNGDWTVDGEPFQALSVLLARNEGRHVFGWPVPDGGWPEGEHQVVFSVDGAVIASVDFTVA